MKAQLWNSQHPWISFGYFAFNLVASNLLLLHLVLATMLKSFYQVREEEMHKEALSKFGKSKNLFVFERSAAEEPKRRVHSTDRDDSEQIELGGLDAGYSRLGNEEQKKVKQALKINKPSHEDLASEQARLEQLQDAENELVAEFAIRKRIAEWTRNKFEESTPQLVEDTKLAQCMLYDNEIDLGIHKNNQPYQKLLVEQKASITIGTRNSFQQQFRTEQLKLDDDLTAIKVGEATSNFGYLEYLSKQRVKYCESPHMVCQDLFQNLETHRAQTEEAIKSRSEDLSTAEKSRRLLKVQSKLKRTCFLLFYSWLPILLETMLLLASCGLSIYHSPSQKHKVILKITIYMQVVSAGWLILSASVRLIMIKSAKYQLRYEHLLWIDLVIGLLVLGELFAASPLLSDPSPSHMLIIIFDTFIHIFGLLR